MKWNHLSQVGWLSLLLLFSACKKNQKPQPTQPQKAASSQPASSRPSKRTGVHKAHQRYARPPQSWIHSRVQKARKRLKKMDPQNIFWRALQAAGGLEKWYSNGALTFRFMYRAGPKRTFDTSQTIDTWSSRAVHTHTKHPTWRFGWDGKHAWRIPKGVKQPINARFWSLTPFYFIGIPFVLADPGVQLKKLKDVRLEGQKYYTFRATFGAHVGDSPKDYYIVYIHTQTFRIGGVRYVVSYPGFFPKGGHTPEKLMIYDGSQTIQGITFPKTFRSYAWNTKRQKPGKAAATARMQDISFQPKQLERFFHRPKDAEQLKGF